MSKEPLVKQVVAQLDYVGPGPKSGSAGKSESSGPENGVSRWWRPNSDLYSQKDNFDLVNDMIYQFLQFFPLELNIISLIGRWRHQHGRHRGESAVNLWYDFNRSILFFSRFSEYGMVQ